MTTITKLLQSENRRLTERQLRDTVVENNPKFVKSLQPTLKHSQISLTAWLQQDDNDNNVQHTLYAVTSTAVTST